MTNKGGKKMLLTSRVAGESLLEVGKLEKIIALAKQSLKNHKDIVSKNLNVEFIIEPETNLELDSESLREITPDSRYSDVKIKEIDIRRVGDKVKLFIRRKSI